MITAQMFRVCHRMFVLLLLVISNYFHFLFEPIDLHTYSYRIWLLILVLFDWMVFTITRW